MPTAVIAEPSEATLLWAADRIIRQHHEEATYADRPDDPRCKRCGNGDGACPMLRWAEAINERAA